MDNQLPLVSVPSRFCQERLRVSRLSPSLRNRIKVKSNTASALEETRKEGMDRVQSYRVPRVIQVGGEELVSSVFIPLSRNIVTRSTVIESMEEN